MRFADGKMVFLFALVAAVSLFLWWALKRKKTLLERFAQQHLVSQITPSLDIRKNVWKNILLIAVLALSVLALMRPQWGFKWQDVKREGLDIIIAIDVSKSMLTQDVKPNRLERSKLAVKDLLKKLNGDRLGLVAFAGTAFLTCPLTTDYNGFLLALEDLSPNTIPRGGTALAAAIRESMKSYENVPSQYKAIILITDGENLESEPVEAAKEAKARGIKIYTIGIGTKEGELIRFVNDAGEEEFVKDKNGNYVKSRLNEDLLQQIASITDGVYVRASGAEFGLDYIYDNRLAQLKKREFKSEREKRYDDRFQIPLGIAALLLVIETCWGVRKRT